MAATYTILYLVPSFLHESRFAIGALIRQGKRLSFVDAPRLPGTECLGGTKEALLLDLVLDRAPALTSTVERDAKSLLGQHIALGPEREVPATVPEPSEWVRTVILPQRAGVARQEPETRRTRDTIAREVLARLRLSTYLQPHAFQPQRIWPAASTTAPHLKPMKHWVSGRNSVLLLEPAFAETAKKGLTDAAERILAYRQLFEILGADAKDSEIVAFVPAGGPGETRETVLHELRKTQADVFDLARKKDVADLADRVRSRHALLGEVR